MNEMQLTQIFLDLWKSEQPAMFRRQKMDFLTRQAKAMASMAMAEIKAMTFSNRTPEEVWSEIAPEMLQSRCPRAETD